jgi:chromosome segregation ATPase
MEATFQNKVLAEYTRDEVEEFFLKSCEELDLRAAVIIDLERKAQELSCRLAKLTHDVKAPAATPDRFTGSQAPSAFRKSQVTVRDLQDEIVERERELGQKRIRRDAINRQIRYFRSLPNVPQRLPKATRPTATLTRDDIRIAITQLIQRKSLPQMANRLQAAVEILSGNYQAADEPLRPLLNSIGENASLGKCLEDRKELWNRETRIAQLTERLASLKERYLRMLDKKKAQAAEFQSEAEQTEQRNRELENLRAEKDLKEHQTSKISESKVIAQNLRVELKSLESQIEKLENDNDARQKRVQTHVQGALFQLREEIAEIEKRIVEAKAINSSFAESMSVLERQQAEAAANRADAEKLFADLQRDYKVIWGTYSKMLEALDSDPFETDRFATFATQMAEKEWDPETVKIAIEEHERLSGELAKISERVAKHEGAESEMSARIAAKRDRITLLEDQLRSLADHLGQSASASPREPLAFTEGAPHIEITEQLTEAIQSDETAVLVHFHDFILDGEFLGDSPSDLFLRMDFLESLGVDTEPVDSQSANFDATLTFTCKNDIILKTFIEKSIVHVQLCRSRGDRKTEIGKVGLNLRPLAQGVQQFSATAELASLDGTSVGTVNYEAAIVYPLVSDKG